MVMRMVPRDQKKDDSLELYSSDAAGEEKMCANHPPPLKGGPLLLAGTHTDLPVHTQTCRRTHRPAGAHTDLPAHTQITTLVPSPIHRQ
jgi:hypothetical protein